MRYLIAAALLLVPLCATGKSYSCHPTVKYSCDREQCGRETEGFSHAEGFAYDSRKWELSACLWTSCYEGKGVHFREGRALVASGKMLNDKGDTMIVTLAISPDNNFTAIWQMSGNGAVLDMGTCAVSDP